ncbi:HEAT repeat domain-containing protein [Brucella intermedia]|uniref:HEAT repeat domain-containing protein n=1 Tax=Brucella intermedia TaxID=94625 RepID=UPI00209B0B33|nr:HEAT repeat domain-containing protein [Brucella intermedia]MCO7727049.1 HEAT repeat domain-containing protein [Brucella intermedia]
MDNTPRQIKRALQDICGHYEAGRKFHDTVEIRPLIHSHLHGADILVRRWSLKALGLIGDPDDTVRIVDRLKIEQDREAQTWGTAALLRNARGRGIKEICAEAKLEKDTSLVLAARLYAPDSWLKSEAEAVTVSLDADDLTLKWAIFLAGYGRAPEDLFSPRHPNEVFLGELNGHPSEDIREYSVWALWERFEYDVRHLKIAKEDVSNHPESVRKWLYRLMLQSPHLNGFSPDVLADLRRDKSPSAREGLARGVVDLKDTIYNAELMDWAVEEKDLLVQEVLLCSLATRQTQDWDITSLIKSRFEAAGPGASLRKKILASAASSHLYPELRQIEAKDAFAAQGMSVFGGQQFTLLPGVGGITMNNGPIFNVGGNLSAQNFVVGDMINSAHGAVQKMDAGHAADKEVLELVLKFVGSHLPGDNGKEIVAAVEATAKEPSKANKERLLGLMKGLAQGTTLAGVVVSEAAEIASTIAGWIG